MFTLLPLPITPILPTSPALQTGRDGMPDSSLTPAPDAAALSAIFPRIRGAEELSLDAALASPAPAARLDLDQRGRVAQMLTQSSEIAAPIGAPFTVQDAIVPVPQPTDVPQAGLDLSAQRPDAIAALLGAPTAAPAALREVIPRDPAPEPRKILDR